mgnify:CR=1 FL=1
MKFKALIMNNFDDCIELMEIKALNEEEAYEKADEMQHNQEFFIILNKERWKNLKKVVCDM